MTNKQKEQKRMRRAKRVRQKIKETNQNLPRLSVFRSNRHIYAQVIDVYNGGKIICSANDFELKDKKGEKTKTKSDIAFLVGELLADKMNKLNIKKAVFDRGFYKYHGRIKSLAEGVKKGGIKV
jgi:large subunit ribosomal protein L18